MLLKDSTSYEVLSNNNARERFQAENGKFAVLGGRGN